jgi:transcriptional regulator with XRE-family HTH domain
MRTSSAILTALKAKLDARKITQKQVADVLGVQQPNVSTLFNPVKKTGKPRDLGFDEGVALIEKFDLGEVPGQINASALARVLQAVLPNLLEVDDVPDGAARALAVALRHALALLANQPAIETDEQTIEMAARAAILRYREASAP